MELEGSLVLLYYTCTCAAAGNQMIWQSVIQISAAFKAQFCVQGDREFEQLSKCRKSQYVTFSEDVFNEGSKLRLPSFWNLKHTMSHRDPLYCQLSSRQQKKI